MLSRYRSIRFLLTFTWILALPACEDEQAKPGEQQVEKAAGSVISHCQVYIGANNGALTVATKDCTTLTDPGFLYGGVINPSRPDGEPFRLPFVKFNREDRLVAFRGHRSSKLGGIYALLEEARKRMIELGFPEEGLGPVPMRFPFQPEGVRIDDHERISYSPADGCIHLAALEDRFSSEPALAPGLAARAYFHAITARFHPSRVSDGSGKESRKGANAYYALCLGWATYFGAAIAGTDAYLDALGPKGEWSLTKKRPVGKSDFKALAELSPGGFDPLPVAGSFAAVLWAGRKTGAGKAGDFDKILMGVFRKKNNPLADPAPRIAKAIEHIAGNIPAGPKDAICNSLHHHFPDIFGEVRACGRRAPTRE